MLANIPPRAGGVLGHSLGAGAFSATGFQKKEMRCEMKGGRVAFVSISCIAIMIASGAVADKPVKPPKPEKTKAECIVFTEDLESVEGSTVIEGCCPNAGPFPAYSMTLDTGSLLDGTHEGQLFINFVGTGPNQQYKVQFWTWDNDTETPGTGDYFFEIQGGEIVNDRRAKVLTVTFSDELGTGWIYHEGNDPTEIPVPGVSFVLVRTTNLDYCEE